jgi:hypothetical protein
MNAKDAYIALKAWRSLPAAVRREVVDLAKDGRPSPDPQVARQGIDWGRAEMPLTYISAFLAVVLLALVHVVGNSPLGFVVKLSLMVPLGSMMFLTIAWARRSHEGAAPVARQNLTARVAAGDYPAQVALRRRRR